MEKIFREFSIDVQDVGGYYQVYEKFKTLKGPRGGILQHGCEMKIGNIYPPGFELFGEIQSQVEWVADFCDGRKRYHADLKAALSTLIRGHGV